MTARRSCPPAPGPLEEYASRFDDLFASLAQRRGLLDPRAEQDDHLSGRSGARTAAAQRLQYFLSESVWDTEQVNGRRLDLMRGQTATAPHADEVIVIDDSGDRRDGTATAHVGRR